MRRLRKTAVRPFRDILKAAKAIAKSWGSQTIPLNTLEHLIDLQRKGLGRANLPDQLKEDYTRVYTTLYKTCEAKMKEMNAKGVSVKYLESCINTIIDGLNEGL